MAKPKISIGQKVTCLHEVEAYYSGYNGNPKVMFTPNDVGIVRSIAPKVHILKCLPVFDGCEDFLVIDFIHPEHGKQRCHLNYCNVRIIKE